MDERNRVLSPANGPLHAKLMFIGEAPGRLGADATQIPFHGDKAGDNFERLIAQVGISRYDCFVTNAVLCNPRGEDGNNAPPSRTEIGNCASFLRRQIEIIDPAVVVTLGSNSLRAADLIERHGLALSKDVRKPVYWNGRTLIPLYHPGQRAMIHRSFANQLADYQLVAEIIRRTQKKPSSKQLRRVDDVVQDSVRAFLFRARHLSYFRLHKLFYLAEYTSFRATGERLSAAYIIRQKDGPYVTDLYAGSLRRSMPDLEVKSKNSELVFNLRQPDEDLFLMQARRFNTSLDQLVDQVWDRYGAMTNRQLKAAVYMTTPMRNLLRLEKYGRQSTFNYPIEFS